MERELQSLQALVSALANISLKFKVLLFTDVHSPLSLSETGFGVQAEGM